MGGYVSTLPNLITARSQHACSMFKNGKGQITLLVTGGDNDGFLDSTEIFNWEEGKKWVHAKSLPFPRSDFSAATLDNIVYAFGGLGGAKKGETAAIMSYDSTDDSWK